jgi:hypothetical protein
MIARARELRRRCGVCFAPVKAFRALPDHAPRTLATAVGQVSTEPATKTSSAAGPNRASSAFTPALVLSRLGEADSISIGPGLSQVSSPVNGSNRTGTHRGASPSNGLVREATFSTDLRLSMQLPKGGSIPSPWVQEGRQLHLFNGRQSRAIVFCDPTPGNT